MIRLSLFSRDCGFGGGWGGAVDILPGFGDALFQLVDEDLVVGSDLLDAGEQIVVAKQRGDRDGEAGDGGEQRGGDARRDRVKVDQIGRASCWERVCQYV